MSSPRHPVTLIVAGAGLRGSVYASYAERAPDRARVVGVADPSDFYRERMVRTHAIPAENVFRDWRAMARRPKFADAVIVATQDALHAEPAIAFARQGYHLLLEKPMAPTERDCRRIVAAVKRSGVIFAVCHVMRYTAYTRAVKSILDSGRIGEVVSIQHLEPVGYWHQAHAFVRGSWRNEAQSSFMLLAKSCHDLDWISYMMGDTPCGRVASFGSLRHFRREQKPAAAGSATRCLACAFEPRCPYSAKRFYLRMAREGHGASFMKVTTDPSEQGMLKALRKGPYGRCVYECDNDVVDNQVVIMEFEGGRTATFTMTAFNEGGGRRTSIFGTRGSLFGDGRTIERFDFLANRREVIDTHTADATAFGGHGGGDSGVIQSFVEAVATGDPGKILSGPDTSLATHRMVFAAERARRLGRVVKLKGPGIKRHSA
jgi:predicted dehydrogenase